MPQKTQRGGIARAQLCFCAAAALALAALLPLAGCATVELVDLPAREADLYPLAQRHDGVSVAIDEISDPERVRRHFGRNLLSDGILPVRILVSNHGTRAVLVGPADVIVTRGRQVLDPLPIEQVVKAARPRGLRVSGGAQAEVAAFLQERALVETVLAPGESYQSLVFLDATPEQDLAWRFLRVLGAYPSPRLRLQLAVTELETSQRQRFGPFALYR